MLSNDAVSYLDYIPLLIEDWMNDKDWWNYDSGKLQYLEKNLFPSHYVHYKPHMDQPWIQTWHPHWEVCK
jgi:hypothetical protein